MAGFARTPGDLPALIFAGQAWPAPRVVAARCLTVQLPTIRPQAADPSSSERERLLPGVALNRTDATAEVVPSPGRETHIGTAESGNYIGEVSRDRAVGVDGGELGVGRSGESTRPGSGVVANAGQRRCCCARAADYEPPIVVEPISGESVIDVDPGVGIRVRRQVWGTAESPHHS